MRRPFAPASAAGTDAPALPALPPVFLPAGLMRAPP